MREFIDAEITERVKPDSGPFADTWLYGWKQVMADSEDGLATSPLDYKSGSATSGTVYQNPAMELNNAAVAVGTKVLLRMRGYVQGQMFWEFWTSTADIGSGTQYHIPAWNGGSSPALIDTLIHTDGGLSALTAPTAVNTAYVNITSGNGWNIQPASLPSDPVWPFYAVDAYSEAMSGGTAYAVGQYRGIGLKFDTLMSRVVLVGGSDVPSCIRYAIRDMEGTTHDGWSGTLADGTVVVGGIITEGGAGSEEDECTYTPPEPGDVFEVPPDILAPIGGDPDNPVTRCFLIGVSGEDGSVGWLNIQMDEIAGGSLADTKATITGPDGGTSVLWDHPTVGIGPFDFRLSPTLLPGTSTPSPWPNIQTHGPSNPVEDDMCAASWVAGADVNNGEWRVCITADAGVTVNPTGLSLEFGEIEITPGGSCAAATTISIDQEVGFTPIGFVFGVSPSPDNWFKIPGLPAGNYQITTTNFIGLDSYAIIRDSCGGTLVSDDTNSGTFPFTWATDGDLFLNCAFSAFATPPVSIKIEAA